ncbi:hypothetical protein EDEG_02848 [Edhazardia aedis USNM 41457]|uniref:Transmembrane protein n=1 Tax=Edhazardia aedis (strain USNM 41457) TaxID=1003232 RepID=J9DJG3_EDHAE|nr:hypothetical protein EDEG_02848 [Edhazardia aedis USNM 41457]|eukprot:EJW02755.1 hypothetical protein EDEG_02848 [Edhazardia aedis USNM 41457]
MQIRSNYTNKIRKMSKTSFFLIFKIRRFQKTNQNKKTVTTRKHYFQLYILTLLSPAKHFKSKIKNCFDTIVIIDYLAFFNILNLYYFDFNHTFDLQLINKKN